MLDALEDEQIAVATAKQLSSSQNSHHSSSANSQKSSTHHSHHGSLDEAGGNSEHSVKSKTSGGPLPSDVVQAFGDLIDDKIDNTSRNHSVASASDKSGGANSHHNVSGSGAQGGIWSPDADAIQAAHLAAKGMTEPEGDVMPQVGPYKSESMGLLDAEGYKFLEGSDSNSDGQDEDD